MNLHTSCSHDLWGWRGSGSRNVGT